MRKLPKNYSRSYVSTWLKKSAKTLRTRLEEVRNGKRSQRDFEITLSFATCSLDLLEMFNFTYEKFRTSLEVLSSGFGYVMDECVMTWTKDEKGYILHNLDEVEQFIELLERVHKEMKIYTEEWIPTKAKFHA
jgi:hypothetical protein